MTPDEFMAANPDLWQIVGWSGGTITQPCDIIKEWIRITTERTPRYYTAQEVWSSYCGEGGGGGTLGEWMPFILIGAIGVGVWFLMKPKR